MYKEGDIVVNLVIETSEGQKVEVGKGKWIVLYFYPKNDTTGCTIQAKIFSNLYERFQKLNTEVIGISRDDPYSHNNFIKKHNLKIKLATDKEGKISSLFNVKGKIFFSRDTVLIDPLGKVVKIWRKVSPSQNPYNILELIENYQKILI